MAKITDLQLRAIHHDLLYESMKKWQKWQTRITIFDIVVTVANFHHFHDGENKICVLRQLTMTLPNQVLLI